LWDPSYVAANVAMIGDLSISGGEEALARFELLVLSVNAG
jgi:hypothetical protein